MKVSVIIPAYRAEVHLGKALDSVGNQSHQQWEVLIHEDGVFDNTEAVVSSFSRRFPGQVTYTNTPDNRGVSHARNRLIDTASGEFIAFLDADDTWETDHLAIALNKMDAEGTDWYVAGLREVDARGIPSGVTMLPPQCFFDQLPGALLDKNFIPTSVVVMKSLTHHAELRFDPSITIGEDLDLWLRMIGQGLKPTLGTNITVNYRRHETNTTNDVIRFHEEFPKVFEKHLITPFLPKGACWRGIKLMLPVVIRMTARKQPRRAMKNLIRIIVAGMRYNIWSLIHSARGSNNAV